MSVVMGTGTGTGVYRGFRYHIYEHGSEAESTAFEEWPDLIERFDRGECSAEELEMIEDTKDGDHIYYFTIEGIDPERWGSYYYGKYHDHSGLMFDILSEIDDELGETHVE